MYEQAKQKCNSELWIVEKDAVFYDIRPLQQPYPRKVSEISGEEVVDFACSQSEAQSLKQSTSASSKFF
jgi:hypothetical protein